MIIQEKSLNQAHFLISKLSQRSYFEYNQLNRFLYERCFVVILLNVKEHFIELFINFENKEMSAFFYLLIKNFWTIYVIEG